MPPRRKKQEEEDVPKPKRGGSSDAPSRNERSAAFLEGFNKKYKDRAQLKKASEYVLPFMTKRLPTGLLTLDLELRGGFPAGGISQIAGPKNSGKSWMTWQVIRQQQFYKGDDFKCLLAMTEMRADRTQARLAGVQISLGDEDVKGLDRARVKSGLPALTKEEIKAYKTEVGEIHELHGQSAEDLFDAIIHAVEQNVYHLIVIDSFGSIMSAAQAEAKSLSEKTYAGASAPITDFLKKLSSLLTMDDDFGNVRDVAIIGINQIRDNIGDPHKEFRSPGGRALEHAKFVDLFVLSGKMVGYEDKVMTPDGMKQQFIQTGKEVNWKIEKGKAGIHEGGKGRYIYDFRINTADFYMDTLIAGITAGIIKTSGAWLEILNETGERILYVNGKEKFIEALAKDAAEKAAAGDSDTLMNRIRQLCFRQAAIHIDYDWA